MRNFNNKIALLITNTVGTAWCIYLFIILGGISLYGAFTNNVQIVLIFGSISSYFLQLVLLPAILTGQNLQAQQSEKRLNEILDLIETQQTEELQELRDDKKLLKNELKILRKVK